MATFIELRVPGPSDDPKRYRLVNLDKITMIRPYPADVGPQAVQVYMLDPKDTIIFEISYAELRDMIWAATDE